MNKKAIAILGGIFLLIIGTLGFLIFQNRNSQTPEPIIVENTDNTNNNNVDNNNNTIPDPNTQIPDANLPSKVVKLSDDQVISPALFFDGSGLAYFDRQGRLWQADLVESGNSMVLDRKNEVSIEIKAGIKKIIWPDKTNNFIAEINSFGEKSYSYYNSQTGMYTDLPRQVISLGFLPGGEKILYIWQENGKATLNEGNGDATGWKEIAEMWEQNNSISISPDGLNVLYFQTVNSSAVNPINLTTPDGKLWRGLVKDGYNTGVLWSPDGQKFLFTKKDSVSLKHQLWNYDVLSGEVKNLGVYTTIEKVTWDKESSNVYVASPDETSPVPQEGVLTTDQVFRVNIQTLEKKEYSLENQKIDGRDLFLNIAGDKLFFKNAQDGFLYYLDLNQ